MTFRTSVSCLVAIFYSYTAIAQESSITLTAKKDPNGKKNFQDEASFSSPMKTNIPIMMDITSGNSGSHPAMLEFFDSALATVTSCKYQGLSGNEQAKLGKKYRLDSCTNGYLSNAAVNFNRVKLSVENGGVTTVTLSISPAVKDTVFLRMCKDSETSEKAKYTVQQIIQSVQAIGCEDAQTKVLVSEELRLVPYIPPYGEWELPFGIFPLAPKPVSRNIEDLSPLGDFKHLKVLILWNNRISDVSPLASLINLEVLVLNNNLISDVRSLSGLINLQKLLLGGNQIIDFSPVKSLPRLVRADFTDLQ